MLRQRVFASWISLAVVFPCVAAAQGAVTASASGTASFEQPLSCGPVSASGASASVSITQCVNDVDLAPPNRYGAYGARGTMGDATATAGVASVDLSAEVYQTGGITYGAAGNVTVSGTSTWNDVLLWNNANVASVGVNYGVTGSAYADEQVDPGYYSGLDNSAHSVIGLNYGSGSVTGSQSWNAFTDQDLYSIIGYQSGHAAASYATQNDLINTSVFQEYDVTGSSLPLFWSVYMNGNVQVGRIASGEENDAYALGRINGKIASLQFFDANHMDITDQVQYAFASEGVSSTPEPSAVALLAPGLFGLIPLVRRRKR